MLERQLTTHNTGHDNKDNVIGELTGERFDSSSLFDKGMPIRSSFTVKRERFDNNSHLDFDLYDNDTKTETKNNKITYNETSSGEYANIDEAMNTITKDSDPYESCVADVNSLSLWINSLMASFNKDDYVINSYGLFSSFGLIYLISKNKQESELKNYFGFQDKKYLNAGLLTIREKTYDYRDQFVLDNYIINDHNIPVDLKISKNLKKLIFNVIINKKYIDNETSRINKIIETVSSMDNVLSSNTLGKSDISLVSVSKISPIWLYNLEKSVKMKINDDYVECLRFVGKTFNYFEDTERQVIEIPTKGEIFNIGLILSKMNYESPTDLKSLNTTISYFKPTVIDEVVFPKINKRYKLRLNKTLQKTGLNIVFSENNPTTLYPEGGMIDDCIQYIDIVFDESSHNMKSQNKGYKTTRKFIVNKQFEYYLRNTENNCIMIFGRY